MARTLLTSHWTPEQLDELKELLYRGKTLASLAVHFRKSRGGLTAKQRQIGLPTPGDLRAHLTKELRRGVLH